MTGALQGFRLDGKVAVVTGGSRGIGHVIAGGLVDAGARVWVTSRRAEAAEEAAAQLAEGGEGREAHGVVCDVTDPAHVERLFAEVAEFAGGCDVLVCAAGLSSAGKAASVDADEMRRMHEVHVLGPLACAQAAHAQMCERGGGAILMVTSVWGLGGQPGTLPYGVAKAGLAHTVKVLAIEWARHGVRVNGLAPGFVETDMTDGLDPAIEEKLLSRVPMRRGAQPEEMVGPALLLCSPAGSYVTGQILAADGGERAR